jgi:hypothetical protein
LFHKLLNTPYLFGDRVCTLRLLLRERFSPLL